MATIIGSGLESYLHQQARERALNRIAEAREEAERLVREAEEQANQAREQILGQTERELVEARRRTIARARLEAQQIAIRRREEFLDRVWDEVQAQLRSPQDREQRLDALLNLIDDAASNLGGGELELQINADDRPLLEGALRDLRGILQERYGVADVRLTAKPAPIWGGVIVRQVGSNQLVDNTFGERFALARRTLRNQVYQLLTTGEEPPL